MKIHKEAELKQLIIIGAGGYSKSVLDSVDKNKIQMTGFIDEFSDKKEHLGYPVLANKFSDLKNPESYVYFIAVGNNINRKRWYDLLKSHNLEIINVIDNSAIVSPNAELSKEGGIFVGKRAIINSGAKIGYNCIINTGALVEHGCFVGNHVNVSTYSILNGDVKVQDGSFIGSSSVSIGQIEIGKWATVGAGAVVIRNVSSNTTVAGVPAKIIKSAVQEGTEYFHV